MRLWNRRPTTRLERVAAVTPLSPVARLVARAPVGIEGTATLVEAARLMRVEGVSSLLVDGGEAIVTERDISRSIGAGADPGEQVATVATPHPLVIDGSLPIIQCGGIMLDEQMRHVLVAMPESWTGVVSIRDVVGVLLRDADPELWSANAPDHHRSANRAN